MTFKKLTLTVCAVSLLLTHLPAYSITLSKKKSNNLIIGGGISLAFVCAVYWFWGWLSPTESNDQLLQRMQERYDAAHNRYHPTSLYHQRDKITIDKESKLFDLVGHKDLNMFSGIPADLKAVRSMGTILKNRIAEQKHEGKSHSGLNSLHKKVGDLNEGLTLMNSFWETHAPFFSLHKRLQSLSSKYNKFSNFTKGDLINEIQYNGEFHSIKEDSYKKFAVGVDRDIRILDAETKSVKQCDMIIMQANSFLYELKGLSSMACGLSLHFNLQNHASKLEKSYGHYFYFDQQQYALNGGVMQQIKGEAVGKGAYPFVEKANALTKDIKLLDEKIKAVQNCNELFNEHNFSMVVTNQLNHTGLLFQGLAYMRDLIASSHEYQQDQQRADKDQRRKKKDAQEEKRQQIERDKAAAEKRKAKAQEDKNRIEQERIESAERNAKLQAKAELMSAVVEQQTQQMKTEQEQAKAKQKEAEVAIEQAKAEQVAPQPPSYDQATQTQPANVTPPTYDQATQTPKDNNEDGEGPGDTEDRPGD